MTSPLLALAFFAAAQTGAPAAPAELACVALVHPPGGTAELVEAPGLRVLEGTAAQGPFRPVLPPHTAAIRCDRTSLVPAAHDDEVLVDLQIPLYITNRSVRPGDYRVTVLEISGGRFQYRFLHGAMAAGEEAGIQQRMDQFQNRLQASR